MRQHTMEANTTKLLQITMYKYSKRNSIHSHFRSTMSKSVLAVVNFSSDASPVDVIFQARTYAKVCCHSLTTWLPSLCHCCTAALLTIHSNFIGPLWTMFQKKKRHLDPNFCILIDFVFVLVQKSRTKTNNVNVLG